MAVKVIDAAKLQRIADVYEVTPATVFGLGTAEPYGATRWRLTEAQAPPG
jgi:hypothetical protein